MTKLVKSYDIPKNGCSRWQIAKVISLLGIPLIVSELGSIAQQFADTAMVGHFSTLDLAAAGFVNSLFYFVIFLVLGISYASTPLIGTAYGKNNSKGVLRILLESLVVNFLTGLFFVVLMTLIILNMESLFFDSVSGPFHQPMEILEHSKPYMIYLTISIPFLTLFYACKQYLDGIGNTGISMIILVCSNILNIFLNWVLIFGKFNLPPMGLAGAGISTLISRIVQLLAIIVAVYRTDVVKRHLPYLLRSKILPTFRGVYEQFRLGIPISIQLGLEIGIFNICGIFSGWLGALPLAAHQTMYTISTLCFQILYGIGAACTIVISQMLGCGRGGIIRKVASTGFFLGLASVAVLTGGICIFFEPLASLFTQDRGVIDFMRLILPCFIAYQPGDCLQIIYANSLRGIKDTKPLTYIAMFSYIVVCIPVCYYTAFKLGFGVSGVWSGIPVGLTLAGVLFFSRFHKKTRHFYQNS